MTERKLASIRKVDSIETIEGADSIEIAVLGGWKVVVKKGQFKKDDLGIYFEIDSWVPDAVAPFLTAEGAKPKLYNGVKGQRLRTALRLKQLSQGLLLPLSILLTEVQEDAQEGLDVTEVLGVQKWEPPLDYVPPEAKGLFPWFIPKTDQARIQNLTRELDDWVTLGLDWQVTEKLDGSSLTVFYKDGEVGVCSRNLELKEDDVNPFWSTIKQYDIPNKLKALGKNIALQGELIGGKIQKNPYRLNYYDFYLYDVFDIDTQTYYLPDETFNLAFILLGIKHVPVIKTNFSMKDLQGIEKPRRTTDLLLYAEGQSWIGSNPVREGLVFKSTTIPNLSFKAVSNTWLLKNKG